MCCFKHLFSSKFNKMFCSSQARKNELAVEDMDGGTFTISNGGVFGSLFGTPIINPPQSAILGMHGIFERPVVINGKVRKHESFMFKILQTQECSKTTLCSSRLRFDQWCMWRWLTTTGSLTAEKLSPFCGRSKQWWKILECCFWTCDVPFFFFFLNHITKKTHKFHATFPVQPSPFLTVMSHSKPGKPVFFSFFFVMSVLTCCLSHCDQNYAKQTEWKDEVFSFLFWVKFKCTWQDVHSICRCFVKLHALRVVIKQWTPFSLKIQVAFPGSVWLRDFLCCMLVGCLSHFFHIGAKESRELMGSRCSNVKIS